MKIRLAVTVSVVALSLTACATQEDAADTDGTWVGTITTEGNVTTVVNESGSVWGGTATLVEDLSIGVDSGADPYMFGRVDAVDATGDRIYVADGQVSTIRVYDWEGNHLLDIGGEGQGPGEFVRLRRMEIDPAGRLLVQDSSRVTVFDLDGNLLDTWTHPPGMDGQLIAADDGTAYVPSYWREGEAPASGFIVLDRDGDEHRRVAKPDFDASAWKLFASSSRERMTTTVPFSPQLTWNVLPSQTTVEGVSHRYRFELQQPDGSATVIERTVELPEVSAEEAQWQTARLTSRLRRLDPDWDWSVNPIPIRRPAFEGFLGDRDGRVWVIRAVRTESVSDCDPTPDVDDPRPTSCWRSVMGLDAFDEETGRYLGQAEVPGIDLLRVQPVFLNNSVITAVQDDAGTIMVKRYRLVLPGEQ